MLRPPLLLRQIPSPRQRDAIPIAVLAQRDVSGRVLPVPPPDPTFDGELSQQDDDVVSFRPVDYVSTTF